MSGGHPAPPYSLLYTSDAANDIASLDGSIKKQLRKVLDEKLAVDPEGYGLPLRGSLTGYWKHEFGQHRVIYRIYQDEKTVVVCAVGARRGKHASDVYQQFEAAAEAGKVAEKVAAVFKSVVSAVKRRP